MKSIFSGLIIKKEKPKFVWLLAFVMVVGLGLLLWYWYGRTIDNTEEPLSMMETKALVSSKPIVVVASRAQKKTHAGLNLKKKTQKPKPASQQEKWSRWGAAPYAHSFAEACRKAPEAIDGTRLPQLVKKHFKKVFETGCRGGRRVWYTPGMSLEQMMSGPDRNHATDWVMNYVSVAELPVLRSPNGRFYLPGSVAETARVREWKWTYEGKTYIWFIPYVCFNEGWRFGPSVLACRTIKYVGKPGDEFRFAILTRERLPASACWQLCDGDDCAAPPSPCDTCDWVGPMSVIPAGFKPLYTGKYVARHSHQSLRLPLGVEQNYVAFCDTRLNVGQSDSWIVQPNVWEKGTVTTVHIPYDGQEWPVWGSSAIDLSKFPRQ